MIESMKKEISKKERMINQKNRLITLFEAKLHIISTLNQNDDEDDGENGID
jgi:hypothetical protein